MYKLEYLPIARKDMVGIMQYISQKLQNPDAAERLALNFIEAAEKIREFPYTGSSYFPIRPLKQEYRKIIVKNYLMFYWINEKEKTITVARILYGKKRC